MTSVARRVVDRQILHLLKMWLEAPVDETDDQGRTRRTTRSRDSKRGIPQGAPISPLLSNLYMRRLVLGWKRLGFERRFGARIVSYADDLVICCRYQAEEALAALRQVATRIGLTVNEDKTHVCRLPQGRFDFLGYSFERCYRSEEHTSELQSRLHLVCRLLLEKKKHSIVSGATLRCPFIPQLRATAWSWSRGLTASPAYDRATAPRGRGDIPHPG